jgi:hypothetical protein
MGKKRNPFIAFLRSVLEARRKRDAELGPTRDLERDRRIRDSQGRKPDRRRSAIKWEDAALKKETDGP